MTTDQILTLIFGLCGTGILTTGLGLLWKISGGVSAYKITMDGNTKAVKDLTATVSKLSERLSHVEGWISNIGNGSGKRDRSNVR